MTDCSVFWHHFLQCFLCSELRETNYVQVGSRCRYVCKLQRACLDIKWLCWSIPSFENLLSWPFLIIARFSLNIPPSSCWLMRNWSSEGTGPALIRKRAFPGPLANCGLSFASLLGNLALQHMDSFFQLSSSWTMLKWFSFISSLK